MRPEFLSSENWPLRGLYWLSKDLFEIDFQEVMEADARALHELRNHLEHKYVKVLSAATSPSNEPFSGTFADTLAHALSLSDLAGRTLRLLQLARSALIYLSLGMHREETRRRENAPSDIQIMPIPLARLDDDSKRHW